MLVIGADEHFTSLATHAPKYCERTDNRPETICPKDGTQARSNMSKKASDKDNHSQCGSNQAIVTASTHKTR